MKPTLNLYEHLLAQGRRYQAVGRRAEATRVLRKLAGLRETPAAMEEETQARLGELELARRRGRPARRHLDAALEHQPTNARYHYMMAAAYAVDEHCEPEKATLHYHKALQIDPDLTQCRCEFGIFLLKNGETDEGLAQLQEAVRRAPHDATAATRLVRALRVLKRFDEATQAARTALFRNPGQQGFVQLWNDHRFRLARREQILSRRRQRATPPSAEPEPTTVLPFVRIDRPAPLPAPHFPRAARRQVQ